MLYEYIKVLLISKLHADSGISMLDLDSKLNCNNAKQSYIAYTMPAVDNDMVQVEQMFAVNVIGAMRMVKYFHKLLIEAHGTIINIGSIAGVTPYVYACKYRCRWILFPLE